MIDAHALGGFAGRDLAQTPRTAPGPRNALRTTLDFQRDPLRFITELTRDYGPVSRFHMGPLEWYVLTNPEHVYDVLVRRWERFHKPRLNKRIFEFFLGDGVVSIDGDEWKRIHKVLVPAFHLRRIEAYGPSMVAYTEAVGASWKNGELRDFSDDMTDLTLSIVGKTLFDADITGYAERIRRAMTDVNRILVDHINSPIPVPAWWPSQRNRRKHAAIREIETIVHELVTARRVEGRDHGDLLSALVFAKDEEGKPLTDREIRDQAMTLVFAGHETTSYALMWMWYLLATHEEPRRRVAEEIDSVLEGGRPPTVEDLLKLPYLEMVVKESLRLLPSVWCFMREPVEDEQIGEYRIPKGAQIFISPYAIHRRPEVFDNPTEFRPERFTRENERRIPRGAYIPFSIGPRVCQGKTFALMEARLILATLLRDFEPRLAPGFEPVLYPKLSMSSANGMKVQIVRRPGR